MALTIAAGFVVDDAIVMIENIARYVEAGETPLAAALKGARQIGFTVVSLTVSLIAVFIPLLLMGGVVGRLFREFAITLSMAVLISGVLSLTLTPMMCAQFLRRDPPGHRPNALFRWSERAFDATRDAYLRSLDRVLRHRMATLFCTGLTLVATIWLYVVIPKGFLPQQDTGLLVGVTDAAQDISFATMAERQRALAEAIAHDPAVRAVDSFVGVGTVNPTLNSGRLYIDIGPPDRRHASVETIMQRLRAAVAGVPGITLHLQPVQDVTIETRPSPTQYQYVLQDLDPLELRTWTQRLLDALRHDATFADVASDQQDEGLQMAIRVDRAAAARYGVTMNVIDNMLYDAFGQRQIAMVYSPLTQYHVVLEASPSFRVDASVLDRIYVTAANALAASTDDAASGVSGGFHAASAPIPLSTFAHVDRQVAPLLITHQGLFPSATISFNLPAGVALGQAVEELHRAERRIGTAGRHNHQSGGLRCRIRRVAVEREAADPGGDRHGLHRAGRALRELHPPDHHPVHAAVRRRRRAARPDAVRREPGPDLADRHHPADRHREEECHHDGGLRAGCRTQRGPDTGGIDPAGMPAALSADHDDDDGGAVGRAAAGTRRRNRIRTAPATRRRDRRRPAAEPVPDALHDAGDLSRVRAFGGACATRAGSGGAVIRRT